MKIISKSVLTVVLAAAGVVAHASNVDNLELEECKSQVAQYYGDSGDMKFVSQRRYRDGTEMKIAVRNEDQSTGYSTTNLAVCWLGADNFLAHSGASDDSMVADIMGPAKASMNDAIPN